MRAGASERRRRRLCFVNTRQRSSSGTSAQCAFSLARSRARPSSSVRRLGSPPFRQSSQCVNSGSRRRRGAAAAAADKAQTGAQTSRKYGIVRQTAGCQRGYGTLQVAALIRPIGPVPGALFNVFNACMERRSMRRIASSSNPSGLPSGHLIRRLPMVFEGWTTDIPLSASQNTPVFNRISFDRPAGAT